MRDTSRTRSSFPSIIALDAYESTCRSARIAHGKQIPAPAIVMLQYTICAFLAPALVSAAAFPWAGPEPTLIVPERDNWSPKTTEAPGLGALELLKRDDGNTCGYISGDASTSKPCDSLAGPALTTRTGRSLTCSNQSNVCVTNTYFGVHGCCDPKNMSACILPTSCIPSSLLAASCTGDCSKDDYIAKWYSRQLRSQYFIMS